ncbi:Atg29 N-terminal domain [Nakaseomyces glabratus]|nr:Atg29 N-terminal domain [Nakaseomyces glabratus]KAH7579991.1 Atg29 N-terminal domain [Nakaseomyces glabratus]KAI8381703.1 Atg29 N-terminal domain [Nakaseomyces glabratus]KAI8391933.1 Atg29 N-terminal domain [Nakaseomyces glabratus]QNG16792.1 uncharacterized protein GWK60_M01925 [Nakaseomyces glabratus]
MNSKNTIVYVKVKGKRPDGFVDPPVFEWNIQKEKKLWSLLSQLNDPDKEIDWALLAEGLDAPIYFLKRRCYELFTKHFELLRQQIDRKNKNALTDRSETPERDSTEEITKEVNFLNQLPVRTPGTIQEEFNEDNGPKDKNKTPDTMKKAIEQLKSSRILNFKGNKLDYNNREEGLTRYDSTYEKEGVHTEETESELSSSLGVSKSTLEEALMDKLQI